MIRNLSVAEYFVVIQKEYLIADFRRKIYFSKNDKAYYKKVADFKKEKINEIANRNRIESIFSEPQKMEQIRLTVFDERGKPTFDMTPQDIKNYYAIGCSFAYNGDIWILDQINEDGTFTIYSESNQLYNNVLKEDVSRIL